MSISGEHSRRKMSRKLRVCERTNGANASNRHNVAQLEKACQCCQLSPNEDYLLHAAAEAFLDRTMHVQFFHTVTRFRGKVYTCPFK